MSLYKDRDIMDEKLSGHYVTHLFAMTKEGLHDKTDIAAELAYRDMIIENLQEAITQLNEIRKKLEPTEVI